MRENNAKAVPNMLPPITSVVQCSPRETRENNIIAKIARIVK